MAKRLLSTAVATAIVGMTSTFCMGVASAQPSELGSSRSMTEFNPRTTTTGHGEPKSGFWQAFAASLTQPRMAPEGVNDWSCKPISEHPTPVVLVHGTWENAYANWAAMGPELKKAGHCVFALNDGENNLLHGGGVGSIMPNTFGLKPIEESARELSSFVDEVLVATDAKKVDLVGHSQGGVVIRQYAKEEGGATPDDPSKNKIRRIVTLGAPHNGTTMDMRANPDEKPDNGQEDTSDSSEKDTTGSSEKDSSSSADTFASSEGNIFKDLEKNITGASAVQQKKDSPFIRGLNEGGYTQPGIDYTIIATAYDQITTPFRSTFFEAGPGAHVDNILVQDDHPNDRSDHLTMSYSPNVIALVKKALD